MLHGTKRRDQMVAQINRRNRTRSWFAQHGEPREGFRRVVVRGFAPPSKVEVDAEVMAFFDARHERRNRGG